jgi:hypothetical protein
MNFKFLKLFIAALVIMMTTFANAGLIAINDGFQTFTANDYTNGYGSLGDANFIDHSYITSLIQGGDDVIIKVSMGIYTDYFKPVDGANILELLTSTINHKWSPDLATSFVNIPGYAGSGLLGGSASWFPLNSTLGDTRQYLPFWGSTNTLGGCCSSTADEVTWNQVFSMETVSVVPEPSTLAIFVLGIMSLASRRFKTKS